MDTLSLGVEMAKHVAQRLAHIGISLDDSEETWCPWIWRLICVYSSVEYISRQSKSWTRCLFRLYSTGSLCRHGPLSLEQTNRMRIRSIIASNANTKSNKCSAMVAKHGMEGKRGAMREWAHANATETSLHSHGRILWLCSQILWLYHSEDKGGKDRMNGPASSYTGSTANIETVRADS